MPKLKTNAEASMPVHQDKSRRKLQYSVSALLGRSKLLMGNQEAETPKPLKFPKPASTPERERVLELIEKAKAGDADAKKEVMAKCTNLIYAVISRTPKFLAAIKDSGLQRSDLVNYGVYGLEHAIMHFDASKGAEFSTYAYTCIRNAISGKLHETRVIHIPETTNLYVTNLELALSFLEEYKKQPIDAWLKSFSERHIVAGNLVKEVLSGKITEDKLRAKLSQLKERVAKGQVSASLDNNPNIDDEYSHRFADVVYPETEDGVIDLIDYKRRVAGIAQLQKLIDHAIITERHKDIHISRMPENPDQITLRQLALKFGIPKETCRRIAVGVEKRLRMLLDGQDINTIPKLKERSTPMKEKIKYLENLTERKLLTKISHVGWLSRLPAYGKRIVLERFDNIILGSLDNYYGVPTFSGLSNKLRLSRRAIKKRVKANIKIQEAMKSAGIKYLDSLSEGDLLKCISLKGWTGGLPEYAQKTVHEKLDKIIVREIEKCEGIPSALRLGKIIGMFSSTIQKRIDENPGLRDAMELRGKKYLEALDEKVLLKKISHKGWTGGLPKYALKIVYARLDGVILREIEKYNGIPSAHGLLGIIGIANRTLKRRIDANPEIIRAMELKGKEYLEGLEEKELIKKISSKNWLLNLPEYALKIVYARINTIHPLWVAFHTKKGLSPEQAEVLWQEKNGVKDKTDMLVVKPVSHSAPSPA